MEVSAFRCVIRVYSIISGVLLWLTGGVCQTQNCTLTYHQCSRIHILRFFSDFKKHDFFVFFWNGVSKKRKKSQKVSNLLNVYRNFGLKPPGCYGYTSIEALSHSPQWHGFLCLHFWARRLMLVTAKLHRVSKKLCQLIFCSLSVKYKPISIKTGKSVAE